MYKGIIFVLCCCILYQTGWCSAVEERGTTAYWFPWGEWMTAGTGRVCLYSRSRNCSTYSFPDCTGLGDDVQNIIFKKACADVTKNDVRMRNNEPYWLDWGDWRQAGIVGYCLMERNRNCSTYDNSQCTGSDVDKRQFYKSCADITPVDLGHKAVYHWLDWGEWRHAGAAGYCLVERNRNCSNYVNADCHGKDVETVEFFKSCNQVTTADIRHKNHPYWLHWGEWRTAGVKGYCLLERNRNCSTFINSDCQGDDVETHEYFKSCADIPKWSNWIPWNCISHGSTDCSMFRERFCSTGHKEDCVQGKAYEIKPCRHDACHNWHDWGPWGQWNCHQQHAGCFMNRFRTCSTGKDEDCAGHPREHVKCHNDHCPVFSQWGEWSCSAAHNMCFQERFRNCSTGHNDDCKGRPSEVESCHIKCPAVETWATWGPWTCQTSVNKKCYEQRTRNCSSGVNTDCKGQFYEVKLCGTRCQSLTQMSTLLPPVQTTLTPSPPSVQTTPTSNTSAVKTTPTSNTSSVKTTPTSNTSAVKTTPTSNTSAVKTTSNSSILTVPSTISTLVYVSKASTITPGSSHAPASTGGQSLSTAKPTSSSSTITTTTASTKPTWGSWTAYPCSVTCGVGTRVSIRTCSTGNNADCVGLPFINEQCDQGPCTVSTTTTTVATTTPVWLQWVAGPCSVTCGNGTRRSHRNCSTGTNIDCPGLPFIDEICLEKPCPVWSKWMAGQCSVTCGNGTRRSHRNCSTGNDADCVGLPYIDESCTEKPCPVWSTWVAGQCSVTCGNGTRKSHRTCSTGSDTDCTGSPNKDEPCTEKPCPYWSAWTSYPCSVTCGTGTRVSLRTCSTGTNSDCPGLPFLSETCQTPCPVWSKWVAGQCSVTCGNGTRKSHRNCSTGNDADCTGSSYKDEPCTETPCPVWSSWIAGQCSVTCGNGTRTSHRNCSNGNDADCPGLSYKAETCQEKNCPVWSNWVPGGKCSVTCGNGTTRSTRNCSSGNDADCPGLSYKDQPCQETPCAVWSKWTIYPCSVTCGDGTRTSLRSCSTGNNADCPGLPFISETCHKPCPGPSTLSTGLSVSSSRTTKAVTGSSTSGVPGHTTTTAVAGSNTTGGQGHTTTTAMAGSSTNGSQGHTTVKQAALPATVYVPKASPVTVSGKSTSPNPTTIPSKPTTIVPTTPVPQVHTTTPGKTPAPVSQQSTQCAVCNGPPVVCEQLYKYQTCTYPNNLCLNRIENSITGGRTVSRRCSDVSTCKREWFAGSSDNDRCQRFDESAVYTLQFSCTYCCTKDKCNTKLHPDKSTLM